MGAAFSTEKEMILVLIAFISCMSIAMVECSIPTAYILTRDPTKVYSLTSFQIYVTLRRDPFKLRFGKFIKSIFKFNVSIVMSISFLAKGQCSKTE